MCRKPWQRPPAIDCKILRVVVKHNAVCTAERASQLTVTYNAVVKHYTQIKVHVRHTCTMWFIFIVTPSLLSGICLGKLLSIYTRDVILFRSDVVVNKII